MASNGQRDRSRPVKSRSTAPSSVGGRRRTIDYPRFNKRGLTRWIPSWKLVLGSLTLFAAVMIGGFAAALAMTTIPDMNAAAASEKTIVYWNDGKTELGRLGEANRISVPMSEIPMDVQHAVLAAEDKNFYDHGGFDPFALGRAVWNATVNDGQTQGASTITQQYAKNAYLTQDKTLDRKARELLLSVKIESEVPKDEIFGNYLNTIYFGRGAYGVQTAAQAYFGKSAKNLTLSEAAVLAAVIRAPTDYEPEKHRDRLQARFDYVLDGMVSQGWLSAQDRKKTKLPEFKKYRATKSSMTGTNGYLLQSVERELLTRGFTEDELDQGGYRITTTFDKTDQEAAVAAVTNSGPGGEAGLRIGLTSIKSDTGEVLAMYGGADYLKNQLSNSDQAIALAGSTFKPFALAAAAEDGIKLDSMWDGSSPRSIGGYRLQNEGNQSYGTISLLRATESSVNTVFVDLAVNGLGPEKVKEAAIRAGLPESTVGLGADPTTVLGTAAPTTEDMAGAYATFSNRGLRVSPTTIKEVRLRQGGPVYQYTPESTRAFSEEVADTVSYALERVVTSGTGFAAAALGRPAAGKTGTTDDNKSAWFVGYTPQITTAVMMAKQDKDGNSISLYGTGGGGSVHGGSYPAAIWTSYMSTAMRDLPVEEFTDPGDQFRGDAYAYSGPAPSTSASPSASSSKKPSGKPSKGAPSSLPSVLPSDVPLGVPSPSVPAVPSPTASASASPTPKPSKKQ